MPIVIQKGVLDDREAYTVFLSCPWSPCSANILKGFSPIGSDSKKVTVTQGKAWLQEALLDRCLLSHLSRLLYNKEHLEHCYLGNNLLLCSMINTYYPCKILQNFHCHIDFKFMHFDLTFVESHLPFFQNANYS